MELDARLDGLGRLVDAAADGFGAPARSVLRQAVEKRAEAVEAYAKEDYAASGKALDEAASLLAGVAPTRAEELGGAVAAGEGARRWARRATWRERGRGRC